jgi:hypothetical protein
LDSISNDQITEALKILEDAAILKKEELMLAISDKYLNFRNCVVAMEDDLVKSVSADKNGTFEMINDTNDIDVSKISELYISRLTDMSTSGIDEICSERQDPKA